MLLRTLEQPEPVVLVGLQEVSSSSGEGRGGKWQSKTCIGDAKRLQSVLICVLAHSLHNEMSVEMVSVVS